MTRMLLGEFDPPDMNPYKKYDHTNWHQIQFVNFQYCRLNSSDYIQSKEHTQLAYNMTTQTIVLLKNDQDIMGFLSHHQRRRLV